MPTLSHAGSVITGGPLPIAATIASRAAAESGAQRSSPSCFFINTIGAWPNRPTARTFAKNLYVAGDYAKNPIDLACMEGAVYASLHAARALLHDAVVVG